MIIKRQCDSYMIQLHLGWYSTQISVLRTGLHPKMFFRKELGAGQCARVTQIDDRGEKIAIKEIKFDKS